MPPEEANESEITEGTKKKKRRRKNRKKKKGANDSQGEDSDEQDGEPLTEATLRDTGDSKVFNLHILGSDSSPDHLSKLSDQEFDKGFLEF